METIDTGVFVFNESKMWTHSRFGGNLNVRQRLRCLLLVLLAWWKSVIFHTFSHSNSHQCKLTWNAKPRGNQFLVIFRVSLPERVVGCYWHSHMAIFKTAKHRMSMNNGLHCNQAIGRAMYAPNHNVVVETVRTLCTVNSYFFGVRAVIGTRRSAHTNFLFPYVNRKWLHTSVIV